MNGKDKRRMTQEEIRELLELRDWSRTKLAGELDLTENTVHQWLSGRRKASGPATILMRLWLIEARALAAAAKPAEPKPGKQLAGAGK